MRHRLSKNVTFGHKNVIIIILKIIDSDEAKLDKPEFPSHFSVK